MASYYKYKPFPINLWRETNCHTSCIIMSVKKSKHDLALYCWHFFGKVHLNRCPRCVWLLWAILSPQKQFPQLFPHQLTLNLNHLDWILIHQSKTTLHSLDEIQWKLQVTFAKRSSSSKKQSITSFWLFPEGQSHEVASVRAAIFKSPRQKSL